jgi:hypothetical protein
MVASDGQADLFAQAQELAVLLYNGLPDRAGFAHAWRKIDPGDLTQAARDSASSSKSPRG